MKRALQAGCALAAALGLLAPGAPAPASPAPLSFAPCRAHQLPVAAHGLQCAELVVPFDRAQPELGSIALAVQRHPAAGPRAGVIVLLAGGPGQPALPAFEAFMAPLAQKPQLRDYELVAFDQRGTGQSQGLICPESSGFAKGISGYFAACGAALGPTRAYYSSSESAADLDALREGLGGTPLSLFAVSYGGRVAGIYARSFPRGLARVVLDSPSPLGGDDALGRQRLRALPRVLDGALCGGGACRSFTANVYADLVRVVTRLHKGPHAALIYNGSGRRQRVYLTERRLLQLLMGIDLAHATRELTPAAITAAAHGDYTPLARLAGASRLETKAESIPIRAPGAAAFASRAAWQPSLEGLEEEAPASDSEDSIALFAATYCVESTLPWESLSPTRERPRALARWLASLGPSAAYPFLPPTATELSALPFCEKWPPTDPAPPDPSGTSAAPTLILAGEDDLRTPLEDDVQVAAGYSHVQLLRIPDTGHSTVTTDPTGCAERAMITFLTSLAAPTECAPSAEPQALPLPPASLGQVHPGRSPSPLAAQAAAAAAWTIEDLLGQDAFRGGGLRGGSWTLEEHGYSLRRMSDVTGVSLSGTIAVLEHSTGTFPFAGHLAVRGRLAGSLTLHGRRITGRLGGFAVSATLAAV